MLQRETAPGSPQPGVRSHLGHGRHSMPSGRETRGGNREGAENFVDRLFEKRFHLLHQRKRQSLVGTRTSCQEMNGI